MSETSSTAEKIASILDSLDMDARRVLQEVIKIEHQYLHLGRPHGITGELQSAIEKAIQ